MSASGKALVEVVEVAAGDPRFDEVMQVAATVLDQRRYLVQQFPAALESHVLGAFQGSRCAGFLRFLVHHLKMQPADTVGTPSRPK